MDPLLWIGIGLGLGLIAPLLAGEGLGLFGDLLFGVLGAFLGGWMANPLFASGDLGSSALTALLGAAVFITTLRLLHARTVATR